MTKLVVLGIAVSKPQAQATNNMSTILPSKPADVAASKGDEEEDIGALIYKESQRRKKEAAAEATAAAEKSKRSSSTSMRTATSIAAIRDGDSSPT